MPPILHRHFEIEQDDARPPLPEYGERLDTGGGTTYVPSRVIEGYTESVAQLEFVINDEHATPRFGFWHRVSQGSARRESLVRGWLWRL